MDSGTDKLKLRVPQQDLRALSMCGHTPKKLEVWVEGLPKVNIGEMARLLYTGIQELNRLQTDPLSRYFLLEVLRPPIHYVCNSLSKHYLNKPIVLPEKANKVANLAQALQNHLVIGYKAAVSQGFPKINDNEMAKMIAYSIHRAMTEQCGTLLRCYQLYFPAPPHLWRELHKLYLLAEHHKLLSYSIKDNSNSMAKTSGIHHAYLRSLLLATAKPNQLRQKEIGLVFKASEIWAKHIKLSATMSDQHLFVANLVSDSEPVYASLVAKREKSPYYRFIECTPLANKLKESLNQRNQPAESDFEIPKGIDDDLVRHLVQAWGRLAQRSFSRSQQPEGSIDISLGLNAAHYFIADKRTFEAVLKGPDNPSGTEESGSTDTRSKFSNAGAEDVWTFAFDAVLTDDAAQLNSQKPVEFGKKGDQTEERPFESFHCKLVNTSPGGFCLSWGDLVPSQVKTGELVGVSEDNQSTWSVGVIRWVKQFADEGARMGLELLAPGAIPVGLKVIPKTGSEAHFQRGLLLPALKAIGQAATIITPKVPFQTGNKIFLNEHGSEGKAQLLNQVASTASFAQFQFKHIGETQAGGRKPPESKINPEDDFDSIWSSL